VALLVVALLGQTLVTNPRYQWDVVAHYLTEPSILRGLELTLGLTAAVMVCGYLLGIGLAAMRLSGNPVLRAFSFGYVWLIRSVPPLVQLLFWYELASLYPTLSLGKPRENYLVLIDRYREQLVAHGHGPAVGYVGAGSGGLFLADTDEEAVSQYRPIYEGFAARLRAQHAGDTRPGKVTSFATIEEAVAHGPALVGTSERVAAKIVDYHKSFRHDVQSVSIFPVLPYHQQQEVLARFAEEVIPLVRREVPPTTLWGPEDPGRAKGFIAVDG